MYKLVAIDLDGTLLDSQKRISDENKKAIGLAMDKGVKIVICSGRIFAGARIFAREIGASGPLIACNGAIIKDLDTEEMLHFNPLGIEDCYKVIDLFHKENIYFHAYIDDAMYTEQLGFSSLFYWKKNQSLPQKDRVDIKLVQDLKAVIASNQIPAAKFVAISKESDQLSRIRGIVEKIPSIKVMSSNVDNFEVVDSKVSKGEALKYISQSFNIKREDIIAIGDNENDISMLEYAGLGVAMENAESCAKEAADYTTFSNDNNGVAEAIRKFVL